jgi:hypothetical protein
MVSGTFSDMADFFPASGIVQVFRGELESGLCPNLENYALERKRIAPSLGAGLSHEQRHKGAENPVCCQQKFYSASLSNSGFR